MSDTQKIELERPDWAIDPADGAERAGHFIRGIVEGATAAGVVLGLSGGIDSAVSAALAVEALGAGRVRGIKMPYATSHPDSSRHADEVAAALGIETETVAITPAVEAFREMLPDMDPIRAGNVMARARMMVLYDVSRRDRTLVLGTGNRTEWLLGYTTLHGDAACGLNPVGQFYKTEIRLLADHLDLPRSVLAKPPSADLWEGQADEKELGFTYSVADTLLHLMVDEGLAPRQLAALGHDAELVDLVRDRMTGNAFKRRLPPFLDLGRPSPDA